MTRHVRHGIWGVLRHRAAPTAPDRVFKALLNPVNGSPSNGGLWLALRDRLDMYQMHPRRLEAVEEARLHSAREGEYYILKDRRDLTYVKLTPRDYYLWTLMDGTRSVKDLIVAYFLQFGAFANGRVCALVEQLHAHQFLTTRSAHLYRTLDRRLQRHSPLVLLRRLRQVFFRSTLTVSGIDGVITACYRAGGRWLFTPAAQAALALISLAGLFCAVEVFQAHRHHLLRTMGSASLGLVTLAIAHAIVVTVHELAHALTTKSFDRTVSRGGFLFYLGLPCFFVDVTDMWLEPTRRRLAVAWAGPYSGIVLASACTITLWLVPTLTAADLVIKVATLGYVSALINLTPFLEFDGYFILMDRLEIPMLRRKALHFLRTNSWKKVIQHEPFTREERIFSVYGSLAVVWTVLAIGFSVYLLEWRFIRTMDDLMTSPDWTVKVIALLVLLVFVLPLALSLIALLILAGRTLVMAALRLPAWQRSERRRDEARTQDHEPAALLQKMPLFAELLPSALAALATRMRVERYAPGAVIIRAGERGSCFYVIKSGAVRVMTPTDGGREQTVASLGPGEYFGEIALLLDVPRTATVITTGPTEVLVLEQHDFEALIAEQKGADIVMHTSNQRLSELQRTSHRPGLVVTR